MEITISTHETEAVDVATESAETEERQADVQPPEDSPSGTVVPPPTEYQPNRQNEQTATELPTGDRENVVTAPREFGPPGSM
ncbi:hypothetical protein [Natrinema halophilum]|uniref:Uncharacterized protein n=1 Tax=Natrinema halophilum TaxID=1699371 RepID=A0A7D5H7Y2_9EURY|nr:hypothetical protein [Natrinema halophilum]QLG49455.1 hypothetical protein HYG82_11560 [Natrinema halophilum]